MPPDRAGRGGPAQWLAIEIVLSLDRHGMAAESLGSERSSDMEVLPFFPQTLRMPKGAPEMRFHALFSVSHEQGSDWSRMTGHWHSIENPGGNREKTSRSRAYSATTMASPSRVRCRVSLPAGCATSRSDH